MKLFRRVVVPVLKPGHLSTEMVLARARARRLIILQPHFKMGKILIKAASVDGPPLTTKSQMSMSWWPQIFASRNHARSVFKAIC